MKIGIQRFSEPELLLAGGARILEARKGLGWSRKELADHARVNRNTVQKAEEGKDITLTTALRLWRALGLLNGVVLPLNVLADYPRQVGQPSPVSPLALWREQTRKAT